MKEEFKQLLKSFNSNQAQPQEAYAVVVLTPVSQSDTSATEFETEPNEIKPVRKS